MSKTQQKLLVVPVGKGRTKKSARTIDDDIDSIAPPKVDEPQQPLKEEQTPESPAAEAPKEETAALKQEQDLPKPKRKRTMTAAAQDSLKRANEGRVRKRIERQIRESIASEQLKQQAEQEQKRIFQEIQDKLNKSADMERRLESKIRQWMMQQQSSNMVAQPCPPPPPPSPESDEYEYSDDEEGEELPAGYVRHDVPRQMNQRPPQLRGKPLPAEPILPSIVSGYWG
jgi:hypothetical protein